MGWLSDPGRRAVLINCHLNINGVGLHKLHAVFFVLIPTLAEGGALIIKSLGSTARYCLHIAVHALLFCAACLSLLLEVMQVAKAV